MKTLYSVNGADLGDFVPILRQTGVYQIRNVTNGRIYIGSATRSFRDRWGCHLRQLNDRTHRNRLLQRSWNKYGAAAFQFEVLETCEPAKCLQCEQRFIDLLNAADPTIGFNLTPTAGNNRGVKYSPETRARMAAAKANISEETRRKIGAKSKGRIPSAEARAKNSASQKGKTRSPETRALIGAKRRGKKHSPEAKLKMSVAVKAGMKRWRESRKVARQLEIEWT